MEWISAETNLALLMTECPAVVRLFLEMRLACVGCSMARFGTVADAAAAHCLELEGFLREIRLVCCGGEQDLNTD